LAKGIRLDREAKRAVRRDLTFQDPPTRETLRHGLKLLTHNTIPSKHNHHRRSIAAGRLHIAAQ
jgi:hypothetical protein